MFSTSARRISSVDEISTSAWRAVLFSGFSFTGLFTFCSFARTGRADRHTTSHPHQPPHVYANAFRYADTRGDGNADANEHACGDEYTYPSHAHRHTAATATDQHGAPAPADCDLHARATAAANQHARAELCVHT